MLGISFRLDGFVKFKYFICFWERGEGKKCFLKWKKKIKKKETVSMTHLWTVSIIFLCFEEKMHSFSRELIFLTRIGSLLPPYLWKSADPTHSAQICPAVGAAVYFTSTSIFSPSSWSQFFQSHHGSTSNPEIKAGHLLLLGMTILTRCGPQHF